MARFYRGRNQTDESVIRDRTIINDGGCWEWQGARSNGKTNYGHFRNKEGKTEYVHRAAYRIFIGAIPEGLDVMHSCDNVICCNPEHLSIGTRSENMRDCIAKGRLRPRGIPYEPDD